MKSYFSVLLICFSISTALAQNTLTGTISTLNTTDPVSATVYLPQLEKGTVSDLDGSYTITNIPNGTYKVIYSALGYATVSRNVVFSEDQTVQEDISMAESAVEIEEVILSTPFHKLQSDNVMKVDRVATQDLNAQGAVTLAEGITNIPGVETISTGAGIGKPVIRGLSANRVLTYTQGVRLENQQFGDEHGLGINEAGIESVEVIKGPASLLYGSDALGGVLYLNPERFATAGETRASARSTFFSNSLGTSTTGGVKTSGERFKFLVRGTHVSHSDYDTGDGFRVTNTRYNESDLKAGFRFQNTRFKSTLRYNYNRSNIGIPEELEEQTTSKELLLPFQEIDNHILSLDNTIFFGNSSLDIKGGYLFNDRREFEGEEHHDDEEDEEPTRMAEGDAALRLKLNTFNYDVKYNLPVLGRFETIVGTQGMFQDNENFGEEILIPDARVRDLGVFATTHYHLEKVDIQAGIRFDSRSIESDAAGDPEDFDFIAALDRDFTSFTGALGAKADLSENLLARVNLASGFRAPNLAELTSNGVHEGTNRYEIGNPDLDNERNLQVDVSLEFRNEHFEAFANGFYNDVQNYIFISPTGEMIGDNFVFNYIQTDSRLYGGEFGVHVHPHPLDWLHLESSFATVTGKLKNGDFLPLIPANAWKNTFRIELEDGEKLQNTYAFVSLNTVFDQDNISEFETRTEGYSLLSAGLGGTFDLNTFRLSIGLSGTNLTNKSYVAHLSRLKVDGLPNPGRSYNVSLRLEI